jgi:hypothetical protein
LDYSRVGFGGAQQLFKFVFGVRAEKNMSRAILHVRTLLPLDVQTKTARNCVAALVGGAGKMYGASATASSWNVV